MIELGQTFTRWIFQHLTACLLKSNRGIYLEADVIRMMLHGQRARGPNSIANQTTKPTEHPPRVRLLLTPSTALRIQQLTSITLIASEGCVAAQSSQRVRP